MKIIRNIYCLIIAMFVSCQQYLDVIPDDIATIDHAFSMRNVAERYLFTCYSWMPNHGAMGSNPAFFGAHEVSPIPTNKAATWGLVQGLQSAQSPIANYWDGGGGGVSMYQAIRDCNIFLEHVAKVPDMEEFERDRWRAEVKFLKAYYHFWLLQLYGPIPLIDESLPIDAGIDDVRVKRMPFDDCVKFIVELIDEAIPALPDMIENEVSELGRITKPIAASVKAKVLVTAASPLFNGNKDYVNFVDQDGSQLINTEYDETKWRRAAEACKEAIDLCHNVGIRLYEYVPPLGQSNISDTTRIQVSIRNSVSERWNSEVIWANPNSIVNQVLFTPRTWDPSRNHNAVRGQYAPPLKMIEHFYSDKGVPIEEDKTFDFAGRFNLKAAGHDDRFNVKEGYTTIGLHFNRENRFYASIGFDGGIWYGQGRFDDKNPFYIMGKAGQITGMHVADAYSVTGYWAKKLINMQNVLEQSSYTVRWYAWPVIRLADLYLLYAEALNESQGPEAPDIHEYVNRVRDRAGLESIEVSWSTYSNRPEKFKTREGLREIIRQERLNELALEGKQYWDVRRWKVAHEVLTKPIVGWNIYEKEAQHYYSRVISNHPVFRLRDYLWPISIQTLLKNDKLVQNPGW